MIAVLVLARRAAAVLQSAAFLREAGRLLTAWTVLFIVGIWMVVCQQWSDMRWVRRLHAEDAAAGAPWPDSALLGDPVLERLPFVAQSWVSDKLVDSSIVGVLLGCGFLARGWRERVMLVRRLGWMVSILYFLRALTVSVTTLPPSIASCSIPTAPKSTWEVVKATPDILAGTVGQCTDKIFSGHTAILTLGFLFWCRYATHWCFIALSAMHAVAGIICVLLVRYHYTIDVVIAILLTYAVHFIYYAALDQAVSLHLAVDDRDMSTIQSKESDELSAFANSNVYRMSVFTAVPPPKITHDGDWRDQDSAFGVEINSGRHTPNTDEHSVRKRDTDHLRTASPSTSHSHHEIDVSEPLTAVGEFPNEVPPDVPRSVAEFCSPAMRDSWRTEVLGINRAFGSFLPSAVAWMDGLDIRLK
ncbi:hypothetical protein GGF46_005451 [Coemansia sp. RSA 552]|nr:hypothetical protein GGF46_005451 [Coemansia sp. RSA 552]